MFLCGSSVRVTISVTICGVPPTPGSLNYHGWGDLRMRFSNSLKWPAAIAVLAVGTADLAAQSNATLMGRITDATGAAVSGAQVSVTLP